MIRRIRSGGPFEPKVGYCRAVVAGGTVYVAGTCAQGDDIPEDVVGQCQSALTVIRSALEEAGTDMAHVVRVTYYLPDIADFEPCWPLLREAFGAHPPAATVIEANLLDPKDRIEIEVTAVLPD
ncbi:RidA family protein [Aestuariibius sp. 2305UL40-4]|uniref:RidA family protein n=1 Tax=Aestuariibius violaceus TaxID=3234132 RepID=UPI00345E8083